MRPRRDRAGRGSDGDGPADADPGRRHLRRALLASALLVVVYFLVPVEADVTGARVVVRTALAAAGVVVVAVLVARLTRCTSRSPPSPPPVSGTSTPRVSSPGRW